MPALSACTPEDRPGTVTVAGGEPGGFYLEFATLLAESLQRHGVADHAVALTTGGSLDNLGQLLTGQATFAVALADAAAQQLATHGTSGAGVTALGRVYENYVHCVVRKGSGIRDLAGLAGRTVAVGEPGSGTSLTTPRLIEAAGLGSAAVGTASAAATEKTVTVLNLGLNDGLAALQDGSVDALFWSGGVPTAAIADSNKEAALAFLDLSALIPSTRTRYGPYYDRVLIPEGSYEGIPGCLDGGCGEPPPVPERPGREDREEDRRTAGGARRGTDPPLQPGGPVPEPGVADQHSRPAVAPGSRCCLPGTPRVTATLSHFLPQNPKRSLTIPKKVRERFGKHRRK